jgi:hypothetical protein
VIAFEWENMPSQLKHDVATAALSCILVVAAGCHHRAGTKSGPSGALTTVLTEQPHMIPDQVNTAGWQKAWTNLVNDVEQAFIPALPKLEAVEVDLVVGNPGTTEELLTLTVLDIDGRVLSVVSKTVQSEKCDQVIFVIPKGGVEVVPGQTYFAKLNGGTTFGWKYVVGGYAKGAATFNGRPLLPGAWSTFLFRTFGAN